MGEENAIMISLNKKKIKSTIQQKKSISTNYIININVHSSTPMTLQLYPAEVEYELLVGACRQMHGPDRHPREVSH